jgi:ribosomal protein S18 acetylase RimI-like enzyme
VDGIVVVRREDGSAVAIRTADIVSGKPVPPRPSPRLRVGTRQAESHASPLWPGVLREPLGEWELRVDPAPTGRLLKRTNSCLAMGDPGIPLADAAARVADFYLARGLTPMVQVETSSDADCWFADAGWSVVPGGDALFLLGSVSRARRALSGSDEATVRTEVDGPRIRATVLQDGHEIGVGHAGLGGDWLGIHTLEVVPTARRRGVARTILRTLLEWGAEHGATTVWLHVETGNDPALALHESLGLQPHHKCRYRTAPA